MAKPSIDRIPFTKITTILAIALGISLGLCGIGVAISDGGNKPGLTGQFFKWMFELGILVFWLSLLGLIFTFVVWVIVSMIQSFTRK